MKRWFPLFPLVLVAAIPNDELPIPWEQLRFEGCYYCIRDAEVTNTLSEVFIEDEFLYLINDNKWPSSDGNVNAQAFIIMYDDREGKKEWVSAPWDYMGTTQQRKHYDAIGDIPEGNDGWKPEKGVTYYFFLTTVCRDPTGFVDAKRTNIVAFEWPVERATPVTTSNCQENAPPPSIEVFDYYPGDVPVETQTDIPADVPTDTSAEEPDGSDLSDILEWFGFKEENNNITLYWRVENSDFLLLEMGTGDSAETTEYDSKEPGVQLRIDHNMIFTLTAGNNCTPVTSWPSKTIFVTGYGSPVPLAAIIKLLLSRQKEHAF